MGYKYRKPIFVGEIETDIRHYLSDTLKNLDMNVITIEIMPDHIHLLVDCKPQLRLFSKRAVIFCILHNGRKKIVYSMQIYTTYKVKIKHYNRIFKDTITVYKSKASAGSTLL